MFNSRDYSFLGWSGVVMLILAYASLTLGFIEENSAAYLAANVSGAGALIIEELHNKDTAPAVGNIFWLLIAVVAVVKSFL